MADLLPSRSDAAGPASDDPKVVGLDSDAADDLISALSSRTARSVLAELHEDPASPSALADRVDTSLQNVQYHIENLSDADVIEVVDTVYSEKGREMKVYAPADRALVVFAGREQETTGLRSALKSLLGGVGVLALASVVVDRLLGGPTADLFGLGAGGGADSAESGGAADDGGAGENVSTDATEYQSQTTEAEAATTDAPGGTTTTDAGGGATETVTETATSAPTSTATETATSAPTSTPSATPEATATSTPTEVATTAVDTTDPQMIADTAAALPPGVVFFLGGLTVLVVAGLYLQIGR
ncbi:ArsR/SmtB family transcription factor [Salinirubrum litoreum]|uniref:ArsR/SmtB family transcription factor n=1 Tax=Salinirubrum litoreum TaxID=1126234 RepID=A0ABD5R9Z2_9EURY|nr:helix-turn-helix domain-containing protein [Salinirubrum litoreum]